MQNLLRLEESLPLYIPLEIIKLITYFADEIVFDLDNTHNDLDLLERNIVKVKETEIGGGYYRVYLKSYYGKALYEYEILNIHFSSDIWYNRAIGLTKTMDRLNGWVSCDKDDLWCLDSTFDENHLMSISNSCIDMLGSFREELDLHIMVKSFIFQINKKCFSYLENNQSLRKF